jgi:tetratricopeptide (TPR) repeat protein
VHEVLVNYSIPEVQNWTELQIQHHPDNTKSRSQYLPLLSIAVDEDKYDDRNAHYYARELYFNGWHELAATEFRRHLALPTALWKPERAWSWRYLANCEPENAVEHLGQAIVEAPEFREPWVDLAKHFYSIEDWQRCLEAAEKALSITEKPLVYLNEAEAWGWLPYDLAAIASYHLGNEIEALTYGQKAVELNSVDARLQSNLEYYKGK